MTSRRSFLTGIAAAASAAALPIALTDNITLSPVIVRAGIDDPAEHGPPTRWVNSLYHSAPSQPYVVKDYGQAAADGRRFWWYGTRSSVRTNTHVQTPSGITGSAPRDTRPYASRDTVRSPEQHGAQRVRTSQHDDGPRTSRSSTPRLVREFAGLGAP